MAYLRAMRICSLLPSATDIVFALGLGDDLVAVTHECDVPAGARAVPAITRSTVASDIVDSREIDRHVTAAAHGGSSLYVLDHVRLEACDPELIITQELCEVCAIGYQHVAAAVRRLDGAATKRTILSVEPRTLPEILDVIVRIGEAAGVRDRAIRLVEDLRGRLDAIGALAGTATSRPRVLAMEWLDPPYTAGHWVPEMIRLAGGHDDLGRPGDFSYEITWDEVVKYEPDVLVLMPCSFDLERTVRDAAPLRRLPSWPRLPAVQQGHVYAVDGGRYFSRHGPSIVDGVAILAEIFHPELFPRHAPARGWRHLD
jgi:iron complex transport system substrate-binding protein